MPEAQDHNNQLPKRAIIGDEPAVFISRDELSTHPVVPARSADEPIPSMEELGLDVPSPEATYSPSYSPSVEPSPAVSPSERTAEERAADLAWLAAQPPIPTRPKKHGPKPVESEPVEVADSSVVDYGPVVEFGPAEVQPVEVHPAEVEFPKETSFAADAKLAREAFFVEPDADTAEPVSPFTVSAQPDDVEPSEHAYSDDSIRDAFDDIFVTPDEDSREEPVLEHFESRYVAADTSREDDESYEDDEDEPRAVTDLSLDIGGSIRKGLNHRKFTSSLAWSAAGMFLPGVGLIGTRARRLGAICLGGFLLAVAFLAVFVARNPLKAAGAVLSAPMLNAIGLVVATSALIWVASIVITHLIRRPQPVTDTQRGIGSVVIGILSFAIAMPMFVVANYAFTSARVVGAVFKSQDETKSETRPTLEPGSDVWKYKPRLNILLLGGDSSAGRDISLGIRTDTIILASIDTRTGDTVMIQLPRNMAKVPFDTSTNLGRELNELYPEGYTDGDGENAAYMINAIWMNVPEDHPKLFENTDYPGADALKVAVAGATGIDPDYFVMLDIDGLQVLIDALGGVTVNINQDLPIGGGDGRKPSGWLRQGPNQKLDGYHAMWYARSRQTTDDYNRMARQSCLIQAVINEADPATMVTKYEAIANAGSQMIATDIPQEMLPPIIELAGKVKDGNITRVMFIHGVNDYNTTDPDFEMIHERVWEALEGSATNLPTQTATQIATESPTEGPSAPSVSDTSSTTTRKTATGWTEPPPVENVEDVCAYNPVE